MNISPEYLALNQQLHAEKPAWGSSARLRINGVLNLEREIDAQTILDYGCGKGLMSRQSGLIMDEYDPAIPGKETIRLSSYDMVICTDVMEHVEPEFVDNVLNEIESLAVKGVYFIIYLVPALHLLPDGSNCHRTIQPAEWWVNKIESIFQCSVVCKSTQTEAEIIVVR